MELRPNKRVNAEFNMSSMTDIIFLLLIFFVITSTVVREPVMKILLPKGVKRNVVKAIVKVYVDAKENYAIDQNKVSKEGFQAALRQKLNQNADVTVSVHADKNLPYGTVMEVVKKADELNAKVVLALNPK